MSLIPHYYLLLIMTIMTMMNLSVKHDDGCYRKFPDIASASAAAAAAFFFFVVAR